MICWPAVRKPLSYFSFCCSLEFYKLNVSDRTGLRILSTVHFIKPVLNMSAWMIVFRARIELFRAFCRISTEICACNKVLAITWNARERSIVLAFHSPFLIFKILCRLLVYTSGVMNSTNLVSVCNNLLDWLS